MFKNGGVLCSKSKLLVSGIISSRSGEYLITGSKKIQPIYKANAIETIEGSDLLIFIMLIRDTHRVFIALAL